MKKTLSVIALLLSLVTILSFGSVATFAESEDATTADSTAVVESAVVDSDADASVSSVADDSADSSAVDSSTVESAVVSETTEETSEPVAEDKDDKKTEFPWALVIFLSLIAIFAIVCVICIKKGNKFGIWLKNFFKDYKSEIKKITWPSREVTIKSTIVVLVCVITCGVVVGLLDFGLGKLVELLMSLVG